MTCYCVKCKCQMFREQDGVYRCPICGTYTTVLKETK